MQWRILLSLNLDQTTPRVQSLIKTGSVVWQLIADQHVRLPRSLFLLLSAIISNSCRYYPIIYSESYANILIRYESKLITWYFDNFLFTLSFIRIFHAEWLVQYLFLLLFSILEIVCKIWTLRWRGLSGWLKMGDNS